MNARALRSSTTVWTALWAAALCAGVFNDAGATQPGREGPVVAGRQPFAVAPVTSASAPNDPAFPVSARRRLGVSPFPLLSEARMLAALTELTAIGKGALWRTSGSAGERAAFDWLASQVEQLEWLRAAGVTVDRQRFRIPLSTEVWEVGLELGSSAGLSSVPVFAMQGHREYLPRTLRFDTDGQANDSERDPVEVRGAVTVVRTYAQLHALSSTALRGRVALVDYAIFDRGLVDSTTGRNRVAELLGKGPAAIVLITEYTNHQGQAHGTFVGDVSSFTSIDTPAAVPTVFARLEDLIPAGVTSWGALAGITQAKVRLDADVMSPGDSQLLAMRIPGVDPSRAVILGAHLDSPNSPGALDNGSGSVALLEVARALDEARSILPVDTYIVWFGSHERGIYGSANFAVAHQELLDRTIAMLQLDCLGHPVEGLSPELFLESFSYTWFGDGRLLLPELMRSAAARNGDALATLDVIGVVSDNSNFQAFAVPNANTIYMDPYRAHEVHIDHHLHDPYDTVELAALHSDTLAAMARAALTAALELGQGDLNLRVTPAPSGRAVVVASHTEPVHMTPTGLLELGMTFAWAGLDLDVVPYGQAVTASDLDGADLVVVLPVADYPSEPTGYGPYDEAWTSGEIAVLQQYADRGGLLVLTNSAYRLKLPYSLIEPNEDWADVNALSSGLGVTYIDRTLESNLAAIRASHPLTQGLVGLSFATNNAMAMSAPGGTVLASAGSDPIVVLLAHGSNGGQVLALADLGLLGSPSGSVPNLRFWQNLASYALSR
jgi:hypothetical protein